MDLNTDILRSSRCTARAVLTLTVAALVLAAGPHRAAALRTLGGVELNNATRAVLERGLPAACREEWQIVMCSDVPASLSRAVAECCALHAGVRRTPPVAAAMVRGEGVQRPDLSAGSSYDWMLGKCTVRRMAEVPEFSRRGDAPTRARLGRQDVPELTPDLIRRIKQAAINASPRRLPEAIAALRENSAAVTRVRGRAGAGAFQHPGGYAGAAELAVMRGRLADAAPLQVAAKESLLTGRGVPPGYTKTGWYPPTHASLDYEGPMPMAKALIDWGGWTKGASSPCPARFPADAPRHMCAHIALVEMDGAASYRSAVAYIATGDDRYARQALDAVLAWAATNSEFGLGDRNGPLEAAWAVSAMARGMELLRASWPGFNQTHLDTFLGWVDGVMMPQMDYYVDDLNPGLLNGDPRDAVQYGNWPATIADAMMAVGVLADDAERYGKGRALFRAVVAGYFKWGRGRWAKGRIIGEATETLRDVYHTLFGLGSLMQAAEMAWGQDEDLYSEQRYVLAAALELHARIINAHANWDERALPPGFRFFESMPNAPEGCAWKWDIGSQLWSAWSKDGSGRMCGTLRDGWKYLLGIKYLPNGFELGYNHYSGRLGMDMPETAALLRRNPVDWYGFCWGLATLTHADTAGELWRPGVGPATLCAVGSGGGGGGSAAARPVGGGGDEAQFSAGQPAPTL